MGLAWLHFHDDSLSLRELSLGEDDVGAEEEQVNHKSSLMRMVNHPIIKIHHEEATHREETYLQEGIILQVGLDHERLLLNETQFNHRDHKTQIRESLRMAHRHEELSVILRLIHRDPQATMNDLEMVESDHERSERQKFVVMTNSLMNLRQRTIGSKKATHLHKQNLLLKPYCDQMIQKRMISISCTSIFSVKHGEII